MNNQGNGKPMTAAWFFLFPGTQLFVFLHSFIHHSAFKLDLDEGTCELTLKGDDSLHYCQSLIESVQENAKLGITFFHGKLPGDKDFTYCVLERTFNKKTLSNLCGRDLMRCLTGHGHLPLTTDIQVSAKMRSH